MKLCKEARTPRHCGDQAGGKKAGQDWAVVTTTGSWLSRAGLAPLQEISNNEAQMILMSKISKRNMARNLTEENNGIKSRIID